FLKDALALLRRNGRRIGQRLHVGGSQSRVSALPYVPLSIQERDDAAAEVARVDASFRDQTKLLIETGRDDDGRGNSQEIGNVILVFGSVAGTGFFPLVH